MAIDKSLVHNLGQSAGMTKAMDADGQRLMLELEDVLTSLEDREARRELRRPSSARLGAVRT